MKEQKIPTEIIKLFDKMHKEVSEEGIKKIKEQEINDGGGVV